MSDIKTIIPEVVKEEIERFSNRLDAAIKKAERLEGFAQKQHGMFSTVGWHMRLQYNVAKYLLAGGIWFWAIERAYFIASEGWHVLAITEAEKICNNISATMLMVAGLLYLLIAVQIIDRLFKK